MSSDYIFGIHDFGGEEQLRAAGKTGWIVFSEAVGHDPNDLMGKDYSGFSREGFGVIVRLNNGYFPQGTVPLSTGYADFARRCANFVAASKGCSRWVIGNEMNYAVERPRVVAGPAARMQVGNLVPGDPTLRSMPARFSALLSGADRERAFDGQDGGEIVTPQHYANCYGLCRDAILSVKNHEKDQVLIGAVAPWNDQTVYPGNPSGDWIKYFQDILLQCGPSGCDGIALHTCTHGANPTLILDNSKVPSFPQHHCHFQAYRDFMQAVPVNMRSLPVYITEADQGGPWENANRGWIQAAYAEIDRWNRLNPQKIHALALYRWPQLDRWHMKGKADVIEDFRLALRHDYRWNKEPEVGAPLDQTGPGTEPGVQPPAYVNGRRRADDGEGRTAEEESAYRVQWLKGKPPSEILAGQNVRFPVSVRNTGSASWPSSGPQQIAFGYRFFQNRKELPLPEDGPLLTPLPHDVAPGEMVTFDAEMDIPDRSGNYTLILDFVRGGENWFQDMQSDILTRWLHVGEARTEQAAPGQAPTVEKSSAAPEWREEGAKRLEEAKAEAAARPSAEPTGPAITDLSGSLPQGDYPFARRTPDQIRQIVICHTSAPPGVPIQAIAEAHISQGYPGIAYHFFVLETGELLQVSELEAVVNDEEEWSLSGVNICLEGNFDTEAPPDRQLTAASQLCAWLLPRLQLTAKDVVGLCDLLDTSSPGNTFHDDANWKKTLRQKIDASLSEPPPPVMPETVKQDDPGEPGGGQAEGLTEEAAAARAPIEDVVTNLPRDARRLIQRHPDDVEYIVINHTAAPPITPLRAIAAAFHRRLPGILYQYFIASNGTIYQTQPLTQVVDGKAPYIARAINVGFAGEFNDDIPTAEQIESARQLITWLMEDFPQLTLASIRGVSEFMNHGSPGEQWLQGRRWKEILLDAIRSQTGSTAPAGSKEASRDSSGPRGGGTGDGEQPPVSQAEERPQVRPNQQMRADVEEPTRLWRQVERPLIRDISSELPSHPTLRYHERPLDSISYVAVHHTGLPPSFGPERISQAHVDADLSRGKRAWPGIGYHYFISEDGELLQTQPVAMRSYHVGRHNYYTVGVVFAGSFMNGYRPNAYQVQNGARLIAWLLQELQIPVSNVLGHQEFTDNYTACPGSEWLEGGRWRDILIAEIERVQNEVPPFHYILFKTEAEMQSTIKEASEYFSKFRPIAGVRLEEALQARFVTLVGTAAAPAEDEERLLREAGVSVDRLDGPEAVSAAQRFSRLARDGRRFLSLPDL